MLKFCRSQTPNYQDGPWSWLVCFAATMSWMAAVGFVFSFGVFFPVFMEQFHEDRERIGMYVDAVLVNSGAYNQCVKPCFQQCFKAIISPCKAKTCFARRR